MNAPAITETQARASEVCVCGQGKRVGEVVCWTCFKQGTLPLKWFDGTFEDWQVERVERQPTITPEAAAVRPQRNTLEVTDTSPGPWYVSSTGNHQGLVISEKDGANIAVTYRKEDAPLIAAAPDLLAACVEAEAAFRQPAGVNVSREFRALEGLRAAIARVTGGAL